MDKKIEWPEIPDTQLEAFQRRLELVETLTDEQIDDGQRMQIRRQYCEHHKVSDRTIRNYLCRYREEGAAGLLFVRKKEPSIRIADERLREAILRRIEESPRRTVPKLRRLLSADPDFHHLIEQVSDRTIYRFLFEQGLTQKKRHSMVHDDRRRAYHQFQASASMVLVQGDARDGIYLPDPDGAVDQQRKTYLFGWVDDYSRKILYARYYWDEKLPRMEDTFKHMILKWGIPEKCYLDNGSVYIAGHFAFVLADLDIKKIHHGAFKAWCKGKVEAVMKTIKNDFQNEAQMAGFKTLDELNTALWAWMDVEYNMRIHSSTGQAPHERFIQGIPKDHRRVTDLQWFEDLFLLREKRKVTKYGNVKLCGNEYHSNSAVHGTTVEVRYNPFDLSKVYRFEGGTSVETLQTRSLVNERAPKIAEESQHASQKVSEASQNYFSDLRKRQDAMKKIFDAPEYSRLKGDRR
jgi:transposase